MPNRNKKKVLNLNNASKLLNTNKKKNKRRKKKSIVSQFLTKGCITNCAKNEETDDIVIVFDSTKQKETEVVESSSESEDSDDMGNCESFDPSVFRSELQNNVDWTSDSIIYAPSQQTSSQVCEQLVEVPSQSQVVEEFLHKDSPERRKLKSIRQWKGTKFGSNITDEVKLSPHLIFTLMSYNVLAQDLLESHPYLYRKHRRQALMWEYRSHLLLKDIQEANPDILCLQEVQASHVDSFYSQLKYLGYEGIFKKRTGDNVDGVAIYYKRELFDLVDYTSVEYFQPGIDILNRHNVGLIAKLAVKGHPQQHIVVATTHLLFNPKRHDVKLAQMQLLLTEMERYAFQGF
ncbi:hypothetical protein L9F63_004241, partial [Diploptera punctata]